MKTAATIILFSAVAVPALPAQTMIKGHHIGETPAEFLQAAPDLASRLRQCQEEMQPRTISPETLKRMSSSEKAMLSMELPGNPTSKVMMEWATNGTLTFPNVRADKEFCTLIEDVFEQGSNKPFSADYDPGPGATGALGAAMAAAAEHTSTLWRFEGGKLAYIHLVFPPSDYGTVKTDLTARIGATPVETSPAFQNGMGARWNDNVDVWLTPQLAATLNLSNNPTSSSLTLEVVPRATFDQTLKSIQERPSPLD